jgi:glycosyltransferase involved in cell wall biosynthesis
MRLVIDYSTSYFHEGNPTGIPRTLKSLSKAIQDVSDLPVEYVILDEEYKHFNKFSFKENKILGRYNPKSNDIFLSFGAPWQHACYLDAISDLKDIIHSFVFVLYDLIPYLFPHFYEEPEFGEYYFRFISKITFQANKVLCISKNTYDDFIKLVNDESTKLKTSVIELGCDFIKVEEKSIKSLSDLEVSKEYILCVGTLEFRKNQNFLLKVYRKILQDRKDFPCLILVGKVGFGNNQIEHQIAYDPVLKDNVKILNCLTDEDIDCLYQNCLFTVYPSLYEGWGLPICESLMYGKNIICSNTSSMREVGSGLCHYFDPISYKELKKSIIKLAVNKLYRVQKESEIKSKYLPNTWNNCAENIITIALN